MSAARTIFKNTLVTGISQVVTSLLGFLLLIYIARYLGEADFGKYSFAMSFTLLFIIFQDIGISNYIVREISRKKELSTDYLINALEIKTVTSFFVFGLVYLSINIMDYPEETKYIVYLFALYTIFTFFAETFKSVFQAFEKMEHTAFVTIFEKTVLFILVFYALYVGYGLIEISYIYVFTGFLAIFLSAILYFLKYTKPKITINFSLWKVLIIGSIPFGLNTLFGMMFFKIDTVMLSIMQDDVAVGIYNAAYIPLLSLTGIISTMVISSIYPVMSKYYMHSTESLAKITVLLSKYMAIIGFPICVGCFMLAESFIKLFYMDQYSDSIIAFKILSLYIPIRFVSSITGTYLTSTNRQRSRTISVAAGSLLNIILNAIMIPSLSYIGASIATVLSEVFLYFIFMHYLKVNFKNMELCRNFVKPLLASLSMGVFLFYCKDTNLIVLIFFAVLVYIVMLLILKTFNNQDIDIVNQIIKRS